jgi:hypothetical protein
MESAQISLQLASPISLGRLPYAPTLDSVLLSLISGGEVLGGDDEVAMQAELSSCITVYDGLPAASALWPLSTVYEVPHTHVRRSANDDVGYWCRGPKAGVLDEQRKNWVTKMTARRTCYSARWAWWAECDIGAVSRWLERLVSVGAKRSAGFGAVVSIEVQKTSAAPWRVHGIEQLVLSRPVPVPALGKWLGPVGCATEDLDDASHAIVPLPAWPTPPWDGGRSVPTMVPLLLSDAE